MLFLPFLQNSKNWVSKENLENFRNAQNIFSEEYATPILDIVAKKSSLAKAFVANGVHISKNYNYFYEKVAQKCHHA